MVRDLIEFLGSERLRWCALALTAALFLFAQAPRTRLTTDPVLYAAVARTMADSGDYFNLRLGDEPYYNKPPLQFWLAAAAIKVFGPNVLAVSLFSRLFGIGCVLLTAWLGSYLYGARVGWIAGLALTSSYVFFRSSATFRLDSALTFGILLALYGYFSSPKNWGPPLFYLGICIAVLSKGPPGILPLFLAPAHAFFSSRDDTAWSQVARWLAWSPLLLLPLCWWLYLLFTDGTEPISMLLDDLMRSKAETSSRFQAFFSNYILLAFSAYYWPWLPFAVVGAWLVVKQLSLSEKNPTDRASAALLLAWIGIAIVSCAFKKAQYPRYVVFALPAVSIITGLGFMRVTGGKYFERLRGSVTLLALAGAVLIACFPTMRVLGTNEQFYSMAELLNNRLPPKSPVPLLKLKPEAKLSITEKSTAIFFLNRPIKLVSLKEVQEASRQARVTLLIQKNELAKISNVLALEVLFNATDYALAEVPRQQVDQMGGTLGEVRSVSRSE